MIPSQIKSMSAYHLALSASGLRRNGVEPSESYFDFYFCSF